MIKVIEIPKENDVEINREDGIVTVSGNIKLDVMIHKSISVRKEDHKLILQTPDEEKYIEILNSTAEEITKRFNMTLHPHFSDFNSADFHGEVRGPEDWVLCWYPFRAAIECAFDTPERMENACNAISKQLLSDGFIIEPNKTWDGKDIFEIKGDTITLLTELGDIFFRPKIYKNKRRYEKIRMEFRKLLPYTCEIAGEWEYFTYFKERLLPIFKKIPNKLINLCALAPPNYNEKPLYYPLIHFHYSGEKEKDYTVYCTKENEYKNEYGFKPEILNRKFEEWDSAFPEFDDLGAAVFPSTSDYKDIIAGISQNPSSMITLQISSENPDEMNEISYLITQHLIKDGFVPKPSEDFRKVGDAFVPKELTQSKLDRDMEMEYKINDSKFVIYINFSHWDSENFGSHYFLLYITSDWNSEIFRYMKALMDSFPNNLKWKMIRLMAGAPPNYKEKPLYYPLIDITRYPDGTIVDRTVYVTKKNKYKDEIEFKPEILDRKFRGGKSK